MDNAERVTGWWIFAAIMLSIGGVLNLIWGIAAVAESKFTTVTGATYVFSDLKTWGWITLILGALQLLAAFSLLGGGGFGRWFAIFMAGLAAIAALLDVGVLPFFSVCVFAPSVIVIFQLATGPTSTPGADGRRSEPAS